MNANKYRSEAEVINAFVEQRQFIASSAKSYDEGNIREARRIAAAAYILFHDGGANSRTKSIISQLGIKDKIKFPSTCKPLEMAPSIGLVLIQMTETETKYVPICQVGACTPEKWPWFKMCSFQNWWNETIFMANTTIKISRKNLVFALRSQDGGAHFDEKWRNDEYRQFATTNDPTFTLSTPSGSRPIPHAHLTSMRQIGWEIDFALADVMGA